MRLPHMKCNTLLMHTLRLETILKFDATFMISINNNLIYISLWFFKIFISAYTNFSFNKNKIYK